MKYKKKIIIDDYEYEVPYHDFTGGNYNHERFIIDLNESGSLVIYKSYDGNEYYYFKGHDITKEEFENRVLLKNINPSAYLLIYG